MGSNGAGKSSIGPSYLPEQFQTPGGVFDGDKLYMQRVKELFPAVTRSHKEAKKIAYQWLIERFEKLVADALTNSQSFAYEGHFTNDATWDVPIKFKRSGYRIHVVFLGLSSPELSEMRVIDRVRDGGHFVARHELEANYFGNLHKLDLYYTVVDNLLVVDTSETNHRVLLHTVSAKIVDILPFEELPAWFTQNLPKLCSAYAIG